MRIWGSFLCWLHLLTAWHVPEIIFSVDTIFHCMDMYMSHYPNLFTSPVHSNLLFEPFQIPCRIHGMEPRYTYLDRCSSVANSSSAACTLLDLELVTISANYCHPAVPVTSAMPNMSSKTPTWQWQGWQRVVCNATTDIHGSRLPVPQSPQDTGCDFPHVSAQCCSVY